ncbi:CgeB family protein [Amorphus suaedae]
MARADPSVELRVWTERPNLDEIAADDLFVFVDPAPDWPLGLETLPCPAIAYIIDVHQNLSIRLDMSRFFDAVFIAQKDYVSAFEAVGHTQAHWLPLACDPNAHHVPAPERDIDVGFVGKLGLAGTDRNATLTRVLPRYTTNDYKRFYPPEQMAALYGRSKIVFNASINGDVNMRVFEAWAAGALLVTDRIENGFAEIFEDGVNCVCYSGVEEAIEKIDYYLAHDAEREAIAAEGQRAAASRHSYRHRWETMMALARPAMGCAPARGYSRGELGKTYARIFSAMRMPWRIPQVLARYGASRASLVELGIAGGRWANWKVPLTPNALAYKFRSRR